MSNRLVTIATFNEPTEAHIVKGRLEAEGIPCYLGDEHIVSVQPFYSVAVGGVKLRVPEDREAVARQLVEQVLEGTSEYYIDDDIELAPPMPEHVHEETCPRCNSTHIAEESFSKTVFSISYLILGFPLPFFNRKFKCYDCGYVWKPKKETK
ncbi:putative signal transducing protein [Botryobacter ruber]|uniref:putative signal transducing protein n=1 Tax=Botryobacter ruber TaxID=2171629 RepID=UPI000E0C6462|nr:DUF2007 domain-containing protein [Botryobacter ruber]